MAEPRATGGCLCGAVRYRVTGPMRDVIDCHCRMCLRTHGHVGAYSSTALPNLQLTESRGLKWYRSSDKARRGFCRECGASLFWHADPGTSISIAAGTIDPPTGLKTVRHIYLADKGDYYEITDGLEQMPGGMG
ncbi:MAG TPA: GFA family protein [Alphaproteobacteria bacterium]|nr:GFA family protein [Alphaproteobacteria bacterium]